MTMIYMIYKGTLENEYLKLKQPLFPEKPGAKNFNSLETRISSVVSAAIAIAVFPLEETFHIANTVKKLSVFPLNFIAYMHGRLKQAPEDKIKAKEVFIHKLDKIKDSAAHALFIPFIRLMFVTRLLAAAILHPRIAF